MWLDHVTQVAQSPRHATGLSQSPFGITLAGSRVGPNVLEFLLTILLKSRSLSPDLYLRRISSLVLSSRLLATRMGGFYDEVIASNGVYKFYSDGEWKETTSSRTVKILNPSTNEAVYQVQG